MKITFWGTAAGIPDPNRHCSCTLLEIGDRAYLIDGGAPVLERVRQYHFDPNRIKAIFTTHAHGDHVSGLLQFLDACGWFYRTAAFDFFMTDASLCDAMVRCMECMQGLPAGGFQKERIRPRIAQAGTVYDDGVLRVTYLPTRHCEPHKSYAILLEAEGKKLLFTGDLSGKLAKGDFPSVATEEKTDLTVCEMAHFTPEQLAPYLDRCPTERLCINHFSPLEKEEQMLSLAAQKGYPFPTRFVRDDETLTL